MAGFSGSRNGPKPDPHSPKPAKSPDPSLEAFRLAGGRQGFSSTNNGLVHSLAFQAGGLPSGMVPNAGRLQYLVRMIGCIGPSNGWMDEKEQGDCAHPRERWFWFFVRAGYPTLGLRR